MLTTKFKIAQNLTQEDLIYFNGYQKKNFSKLKDGNHDFRQESFNRTVVMACDNHQKGSPHLLAAVLESPRRCLDICKRLSPVKAVRTTGLILAFPSLLCLFILSALLGGKENTAEPWVSDIRPVL